MTNRIYKEIFQKIKLSNNILLVAHVKPDLDTISSLCAMSGFLDKLGKKYTSYCVDSIHSGYFFLPYSTNINSKKLLNFNKFDLIITLDCGSIVRTGILLEINNRNNSQQIINIDHHIKIDNFADLEIKDCGASSTAEILYNFFKINNINIDKNIAKCILTGILADSGNFLFSNTNYKNMTIAAEMLTRGADWLNITSNIVCNKKIQTLRFWGTVISRLKINKKYNIAFTILNSNDIKNIDQKDLDGLPEFISTLSNVKCIILLKQETSKLIRGNIRSSYNKIDVSILANIFGGGGNKKTAGFVVEGRIQSSNNHFRVE